jgi:hypothetical protein
MPTPPASRKLYLALCVNAALMGLVAVGLWTRGLAAPAMAQVVPAAPATANGLTIMPAQLAPQVFGCYLLDADRQTLGVYLYRPGDHELQLEASRDVQYDRQLRDYNTDPSPAATRQMAERAALPNRAVPPRQGE